MAHLYKKTYSTTDPRTGGRVTRKRRNWRVRYRDADGVMRDATTPVVYVSKAGNNDNDGSTWAQAKQTITAGIATVLETGGELLDSVSPATGKLIWKFDMNPKDSKWILGGRGTRNNVISTPVIHENIVYLGVGQDPEHGEGSDSIFR